MAMNGYFTENVNNYYNACLSNFQPPGSIINNNLPSPVVSIIQPISNYTGSFVSSILLISFLIFSFSIFKKK